MRLFELRRTEDESGVSGTGTVAQGVIFDNGWCALTWLTQHTSVAFYTSIEEVIAIHGHNGKTKVVQIANCDDMKTIKGWCANYGQDIIEGVIADFHDGNHKYVWDQREKFVNLFKEKVLDRSAEQKEEEKTKRRYELKDLFEIKDEDRQKIYEYAMRRSSDIVKSLVDVAVEKTQEYLKK